MINIQERIDQNPRIVLLQDNSSSILMGKDSLFYKQNYSNFLDSKINIKNAYFDIISFDSEIKKGYPDFNGTATDLNLVLKHVSDLYSNSNVAAYILISDGIHNKGLNPVLQKYNLNAPLHTILIGDTTTAQDAFISSVYHNKVNYLGNKIPIEVIYNAVDFKGAELTLEVFDMLRDSLKQSSIFTEKVTVFNDNFVNKTQFYISPKNPGFQNYLVDLKTNFPEENIINNKKIIFLDVIDDRKSILILFGNPHPDIAAIKESLEKYDQYQIESKWINHVAQHDYIDFENYDLIITHQLALNSQFNQIIELQNKPVWHIIGKNSDLRDFDNQNNFSSDSNNNTFEFAKVSINNQFSAFSIDDSLSNLLSNSIPLIVPSTDFKVVHPHEVLMYKQVDSIQTQSPILLFLEKENTAAYLFAEGLWRWKLNDYYVNENNKHFDHFLSKVVMYMFSDSNRKRLHINYKKVQSQQNSIYLTAELYDKNFQMINDYDINFILLDSLNNSYNYKFIPTKNNYDLYLNLNSGHYDFTASVEIGNEVLIEKGKFLVSTFSIEEQNNIANYKLLNNLSFLNRGKTTSLDSLDNLLANITKSKDFTTKTDYINNYKPLINYKMLLVIIIFLSFLEWFLRRRYINY